MFRVWGCAELSCQPQHQHQHQHRTLPAYQKLSGLDIRKGNEQILGVLIGIPKLVADSKIYQLATCRLFKRGNMPLLATVYLPYGSRRQAYGSRRQVYGNVVLG